MVIAGILPLVTAGLSVLPKLPEAWEAVAGLFGKRVPDSIKAAGELAGEIIGEIEKGKVSAEQQIQLKSLFYEHEQRIQELSLREKEMEYEHLQRQNEQFVKLWTADTQSTNRFVAETRPLILRRFFWLCAIYSVVTPLSALGMVKLGLSSGDLGIYFGVLKWIGGWMFGTFTAGYLGYVAGRSIDKKSPHLKGQNDLLGKVLRGILGKEVPGTLAP